MKDDLGNRMKEFYENRTKYKLPRRTNTIIRLDGKAFHTFTRGFEKPFDICVRISIGKKEIMEEFIKEFRKWLLKNQDDNN